MPKLASKNGRSARLASGTTKYDAHHTVLSKTYGALADLRRELSDSKSRVAEREEILRIFATCADSQRAWLLLEDYFEKLALSRKDFGGQEWWPRLMAATGKARLEEVAILFLRATRPLPTELVAHANIARFAELEQAELEQKQAELESRLEDQERLEKEAGMLTLLRRLLEEEQNAMATQYTAPLTERIGRYLAQVFPDAPQTSLSYDARSGFQELQWRRGNEAAFGFDVLSTGAREQFAAALRVTMAEVLAEAYDGSLPVLFDDAFANSDPERQAGVFRMLQQAADQGLQVILLTCDPERSRGIEGASHTSLGL